MFPGANDNASGVAVLLELARLFAVHPPLIPVRLVLLDMSVQGALDHQKTLVMGSRFFARHYAGPTPVGIVVLQMVGGEYLSIRKNYYCLTYAPAWTEFVWDEARELELFQFEAEQTDSFFSDHVPMLKQNLPAVFIGDSEYPYRNSPEDGIDQCSPESLGAVGRLIVRLIYGTQEEQN